MTGFPRRLAEALLRNNRPLLAYIAGKPPHFTTKEHNYLAGQTVEKQAIIINDSRAMVECDCSWSLDLLAAAGHPVGHPVPGSGSRSKTLTIRAGEQQRMPLSFTLPADIRPGRVSTRADGQVQHGRNAGGHVSRSMSWRPPSRPS